MCLMGGPEYASLSDPNLTPAVTMVLTFSALGI